MDRERLEEIARRFIGTDLTPVHFAWLTLLAAVSLSVLGVYGIDLASSATPPDGAPVTLAGRPLKQMLFLVVSVLAGAAAVVPHFRLYRLLAWPGAVVFLGLLIFLLLPFVPAWLVTPRNGARGWIDLGPVDFQPAEIAKIVYVLVIADYLRYRRNHRTFTGLIPPALITFVPVALITLQPDLGTASLFIPALFAMLVAAGAKLKHLIFVVVVAALAGPFAYPFLHDHQQQRILGLIEMVQGSREGADDINYQSFTAMKLAGAGQTGGVDDARSRALIEFNSLPEAHNDMIYAVLVNRFGFVGGVAVLALYGLWLLGALLSAAVCRDPFGRLVIVGFIAIVGAQAFINVGMNLGLLPIIGLTLPFLSYGGSSLLTVWLMTGMIFGIAMRPAVGLVRRSFEFAEEDDED